MPLSETRLLAQAAWVARRLRAERLVKTASPALLRREIEAVLLQDRDRERALDEEVAKLLRENAPALRAKGVDYSEMFRKAKRMLAAKRKIPL